MPTSEVWSERPGLVLGSCGQLREKFRGLTVTFSAPRPPRAAPFLGQPLVDQHWGQALTVAGQGIQQATVAVAGDWPLHRRGFVEQRHHSLRCAAPSVPPLFDPFTP